MLPNWRRTATLPLRLAEKPGLPAMSLAIRKEQPFASLKIQGWRGRGLIAFGYWLVLFSGLFINSSFLFNAAPNGGWFNYAPLNELTTNCGNAVMCTPGMNADFWILGTMMLGVSSLTGALNFVVTILRMRAPGMSINRMPLFSWMITTGRPAPKAR